MHGTSPKKKNKKTLSRSLRDFSARLILMENYIIWECIISLRKQHSTVWISGSISLIIWGEHGIHCMPCSSRILSKMTPQICYHSNKRCKTRIWFILFILYYMYIWDDPNTRPAPLIALNYKLVCLVPWQYVISVTSLRHQYDVIVVTLTYLWRNWDRNMADSVCHALSILSTESIHFLKQIIK